MTMTKAQFDAAQLADKQQYDEIMREKAERWAAEAEAAKRSVEARRTGEKADRSRIPSIEEALQPGRAATLEALKQARIQSVLNPPPWVQYRLPPNDPLIVAARERALNPYADEIEAMRQALAEVQK